MTVTDDIPAQPSYIPAAEVCQRAGVTYRQLDYWGRRGFIPCQETKGSGYPRRFTEDDVTYIALFAKLVKAGLDHDRADAVMKSKLDQVRDGVVRLTDDIVLVFEAADGA